MLVYTSFAGGICAVTAAEAGPAFGTVGLHLSWQVYAIIAFVLVMALAYLDIKVSATVILALEGVSMLLVVIASSIVLAKGGLPRTCLQLSTVPAQRSHLVRARPRGRPVVLDLLRI